MPQPQKRTPGAVDNSDRTRSKPGIAPSVKRIPGERDPSDPSAKKMDPVMSLIVGKTTTQNETVNYFIDKIKALGEEGVELEAVYKEAAATQSAAQQRLTVIRCSVEKYKEDINEWRLRPGAKPAELE